MSHYTILSPDGFSINLDGFTSIRKAQAFFLEWIERYRPQGYYSSPKWGRIPLEDIESYCDLIKS